MKLLWLMTEYPYPPTGGAPVRIYNVMREMARRHEVHGIAVVDTDSALPVHDATRFPIASMSFFRRMPRPGFAGRARASFSRIPRLVSAVAPPDNLRQLEKSIARHRFDAAVLESIYVGGFVPALQKAGIPQVLVNHNIESRLWRDIARYRPAYNNRLSEWWEVYKLTRYEAHLARSVTYRVAMSEQDRQLFERMSGVPCGVSPNGVDIEFFPYYPRARAEDGSPWRLIMTGTMNYQPNIDAAEYFADEILPLVQSMHQAQAAFVGRSPAPELVARQKRDRSLIFTGAVDDVRPYVAQADIFIVPLRHGSGTRLKILEAMSQGIPVVTTTIGCEGLDVRHGEHVWIADTPEAFRDGIVTLMRNPAGAANMVARARALVEQKYTWTEIARQLEADLYRIVPAQAGILA